jgi:two-component system cell cycle sensor histidine kinase/response regulator CckA
VLDDEDMVRNMLEKLLTLQGHSVVAVPNGQEAVARYQEALRGQQPFNLAILDLTIPGEMGGVEVLRRLKAVDLHVKAIASSGYSTDPVMSDHRSYGFCARLPKPYSREELEAAMVMALKK